jgi:hypothetical protein
MNGEILSKNDIAKIFVLTILKLFPKEKIIVVVDGLYTTDKKTRPQATEF